MIKDMSGLRAAIPATSVGQPGIHGISQRLAEIARHGFKGIEVTEDDIDSYAVQLSGGLAVADNHLTAASTIKQACDQLELSVIAFQPFRFYEGLLDRNQHERMITKLRLWLNICKVLGTNMIQIPTNWLPQGTTADPELVVADLTEMADLGLTQDPIIHFAYEGVAWGTHYDTWQGTWELVRKVNRPNFGLCLDTFHIAGRVWGDPASLDGKTPNADRDLDLSMDQMAAEVDVNKIFYIQVGDAERLDAVLDQNHPFYSSQQPTRMSWSRNARLFAYEGHLGGYLPFEKVVRTIVHRLGYQGWVSLELFSHQLKVPDPEVPKKYATRAAESWRQLSERLGI